MAIDRQKQKARSRAYYLANRERVLARTKAWAAANREKAKEIGRAWDAANPERARARHAASYERNREKVIARATTRRLANPEKFRAYNRKYYATHAEKEKARNKVSRLRRYYGLTPEAFDALLAAQGGACRICWAIRAGGNGRWHVDHDHDCCPGERSCGKCVRGLLCSSCNLMLGHAGDSPEVLRRAIEHLEAPRRLRVVVAG